MSLIIGIEIHLARFICSILFNRTNYCEVLFDKVRLKYSYGNARVYNFCEDHGFIFIYSISLITRQNR